MNSLENNKECQRKKIEDHKLINMEIKEGNKDL